MSSGDAWQPESEQARPELLPESDAPISSDDARPDPVGAVHAGDKACSSCVGTGRVVAQTSPTRAQCQAGGFAEAAMSVFCDVPSVAWLTGLRIDSGHGAPSSSRFRSHGPFPGPAGQGDLAAEEFTITEPTCQAGNVTESAAHGANDAATVMSPTDAWNDSNVGTSSVSRFESQEPASALLKHGKCNKGQDRLCRK